MSKNQFRGVVLAVVVGALQASAATLNFEGKASNGAVFNLTIAMPEDGQVVLIRNGIERLVTIPVASGPMPENKPVDGSATVRLPAPVAKAAAPAAAIIPMFVGVELRAKVVSKGRIELSSTEFTQSGVTIAQREGAKIEVPEIRTKSGAATIDYPGETTTLAGFTLLKVNATK